MSESDRKKYVRLTEIEKKMMIDDYTSILSKVNEFLIYPTPLYEIFLDKSNEDLLELLVSPNVLEEKLSTLKNDEKSINSTDVDTFTFIRDISQNNNLFEFETIELSEASNFQKYISSNLKNLVILKYSFIFFDYYKDFYSKWEEKINSTLTTKNLYDFEDTKKELLNLDYSSYEDFLSIVFPLEDDFDLKSIIIKINNQEELNRFKLALHTFDDNNFALDNVRFHDNLINNYINPRIKLIIESLESIISDVINHLNSIQTPRIQINQTPYNNYYVFMINVKEVTKSGDWILKGLIEKLQNNNSESSKRSQGLNNTESNEKTEIETPQMQNLLKKYTLITPFIELDDWISTKKEEVENLTIKEFSHLIKKKLTDYYLNKILDNFYVKIGSYLKFCIESHNRLLKIPNFPLMISENLLKAEEITKDDTIIQLFEKLNRLLDRLNKIVNERLVKDWHQNFIVNFHFINSCVSLINSAIYLKEDIEVTEIKDCKLLKFWDNLINLATSQNVISNCNIARNYITELYEKYSNSENIFRYDVIIDEIVFNASLMAKFRNLINRDIKSLFDGSSVASIEEKQIISAIIDRESISYQNRRIQEALINLHDNKIIKEVSTYVLGI